MSLGVSYLAYLVRNWREMVPEQLARFQRSGLYDAAGTIWISCNDPDGKQLPEFKEILSKWPKAELKAVEPNGYEFPGINLAQELARAGHEKVLYWHTKGIVNVYHDTATGKDWEPKVTGKRDWRLFMEHFMVDRWQDCVKALDDHDVVAAFYHHGDNWPWGNFWWTRADHILRGQVGRADRWYYEAFIAQRCGAPRMFEFWHPDFELGASDIPPWLYDRSRDLSNETFSVHRAEYGTYDLQVNENTAAPQPPCVPLDTTEFVRANALCDNGRRLRLPPVHAGMFESDPHPGAQKMITVWWSLASETDKIHRSRAVDGWPLNISLDDIPN